MTLIVNCRRCWSGQIMKPLLPTPGRRAGPFLVSGPRYWRCRRSGSPPAASAGPPRKLSPSDVVNSVHQLNATRLVVLWQQVIQPLLVLVLELHWVGVVLLQLRLHPYHVKHGVGKAGWFSRMNPLGGESNSGDWSFISECWWWWSTRCLRCSQSSYPWPPPGGCWTRARRWCRQSPCSDLDTQTSP